MADRQAQCWPHLFVATGPLGLFMRAIPFAPTTQAAHAGRCACGRARVLCDDVDDPCDVCDCPIILEESCPRLRAAGIRRMMALHDTENLW